jgi:hypothetical protein
MFFFNYDVVPLPKCNADNNNNGISFHLLEKEITKKGPKHSKNKKNKNKKKYGSGAVVDQFVSHDWDRIRHILNSPRQRKKLCRYKDEVNTSVLAIALGFLAPLDIIQRMYQTNPAAAFIIDDCGANPLHIACLNGASYDNIDYILSQETAAPASATSRGVGHSLLATELDHDNRCALHHAVEFACLDTKPLAVYPRTRVHLNTADEEEQEHQYSSSHLRVIRRVIQAAPEMMNARDKNFEGNTPIDLVQIVKFDKANTASKEEYQRLDEIYKLLLRASIEYYTRTKREWEEAGYEKK